MRHQLIGAALGASVFCSSGALCAHEPVAVMGGLVYDGTGFREADLFIVDGLFTEDRPEVIGTEIDAAGKYVVPPYGDAHTHNFDRPGSSGFSQTSTSRRGRSTS